MTVLVNEVLIGAPPSAVWAVLAQLDALAGYDPGVARSEIDSSVACGIGASRRCTLKEGGWFRERVTLWNPEQELAFELFDCTLPVRSLKHHYSLDAERNGTRVAQRMEYALKFGLVGVILDVLVVRRKWDVGIKAFLQGLKATAEQRARSGPTRGASLVSLAPSS